MDINETIKQFLLKQKSYIMLYIILLMVFPITGVLLPIYFGNIMEDIKNNKKPKIIIVFVLLVITIIMSWFLDKLDTIFIPKFQSFIRDNIVKIILNNTKDSFEEQELGLLISKIVKLPIVVKALFRDIRSQIIPVILVLLFIGVRFLIIKPVIGVIVIIGLIAIISNAIIQCKKCLNNSIELDDTTDNVHENISELFDNLLNVYSSNTIKKELKKIENEQDLIVNNYKKTFNCVNTTRFWFSTSSTILFCGISIYSYKLFITKKINISTLIAIVITSSFIIGKIGSFAGSLPDLIFNLGVYIRINKYVNNLQQETFNKELYIHGGGIQFYNIGIQYNNKYVIRNFNLNILPGEKIIISGSVGSGKSSLLKILLKLIKISEGKILIDKQNISDISSSSLRSHIIYIQQNPIPFNRSLFDNIIYGTNTTKSEVIDMFNKFNLHNTFKNISLDDNVGRKGSKLSGGQKIIMFLLRIILHKNKKIIVLDEPTASVDSKSRDLIMNLIKVASIDKTMIIVTHDESILEFADKKILI